MGTLIFGVVAFLLRIGIINIRIRESSVLTCAVAATLRVMVIGWRL